MMPEAPDFERIANRIAMSLPGAIGPPFALLGERIAQELRSAWNARGAADVVTLEASLRGRLGEKSAGPYIRHLVRALRSLDV